MLSRRTIGRELFRLAAPIIGLNVLSVLTLAVDTAMCGRLDNAKDALTALGFATQIVFLLLVAMMGLVVGTVALVARAHGAQDQDRVSHLVRQSTQLTIVIGIGMGSIGFIFAELIVTALGAAPHIAALAAEYLRPLMLGATFYYLMILYGAMCRGVGNTRLPFLVALVANTLNVALNYGLILGNYGLPALGVQGAAIGTVISQIVSVTIMVIILKRGTVQGLVLKLRPRKLDRKLARELFSIGFPAALDMVILNASFLSVVGMLGRIDDLAVAAHGIGLRVQAIAFVPGLGISQATAALVGQALGASDIDRTRQIIRSSIFFCVGVMSFLALVFIVAAYPIVSIFDVAPGSAVEGYAVLWMRILGYGMPLFGVHIALIGLFQGSGATRISLRLNFIGTVFVQIPLSALLAFPFGLGALGLWLSFPLSYIVKLALGIAAYRTGSWAKTGLRVRP